MKEKEEIFHFKQFDIHHDRCAMKVGTDGVLLGAWATLPEGPCPRLLDIGSGTGLIALMMAQRLVDNARPSFSNEYTGKNNQPLDIDNLPLEDARPNFSIEGIEIVPEAALQAQENCAASPWHERVSIFAGSLSDWMKEQEEPLPHFDSILSNPPFYNATLKPEEEARAMARHKDALPLEQIMTCASHYLSPMGRLSLVYPMAYDSEVMTAAILANLKPCRICDVLTKEGKPCKRRLAEFCLSSAPLSLVNETLSLRDASGDYSPHYRALTDAFYTQLR